MTSTLVTSEEDIVILKAGWVFRQKPLFKKWKKSWLVVSLGGSLKHYSSKRSTRPQKTFNMRQDCMAIKTGRQCKTLLPPKDIDTGCLIELHFTGGRKLSLCAHDLDSANLWMQALTRAQSDKALPTPRFSRNNTTKEEAMLIENKVVNQRQKSVWYKLLCCGGANKVQKFSTPRQALN